MLDQEGVIRYGTFAAALEMAVKALLKKLPKTGADAVAAAGKPQSQSNPLPRPTPRVPIGTLRSRRKNIRLFCVAANSGGTGNELRLWTRRDGKTATLRLVAVEDDGAHWPCQRESVCRST